MASFTRDGGETWTQVVVPVGTICSGSGDFERATDPWVSFGPTGWAHAMSLVTDSDPVTSGGFGDNGMTYNRSKDGGQTWEAPIYLKVDTDPRFLNDKNAITADPNDANYVYAVWDRPRPPGARSLPRPRGGRTFSVSASGGRRGSPAPPTAATRSSRRGSSITPRAPTTRRSATGSPCCPASEGGDVLDFFNEIVNFRNGDGGAQFEFNLSLIRSVDQGSTWTSNASRITKFYPMDRVREDGVIDTEPVGCPDPGDVAACPIRTGDILFDVAVDRADGTLYAVVQDARPSGFSYDTIALTRSTDEGASWSPLARINAGSDAERDSMTVRRSRPPCTSPTTAPSW